MYGLVIKRGSGIYFAVAPNKRNFQDWQRAIDSVTSDVPAQDCAWRMRDKTGWIDGSDNAWKSIPDWPAGEAVVLW